VVLGQAHENAEKKALEMLRLVASFLAAFVGFSVGHSFIPKMIDHRNNQLKKKLQEAAAKQPNAAGLSPPSLPSSTPRSLPVRRLSLRRKSVKRLKIPLWKHYTSDVEKCRRSYISRGQKNAQNDSSDGFFSASDARQGYNAPSECSSISAWPCVNPNARCHVLISGTDSVSCCNQQRISTDTMEAKVSRVRELKEKLIALKSKAMSSDRVPRSSSQVKISTNQPLVSRNAKSDSQWIRHAISSSPMCLLSMQPQTERER
jgi:hypothetical protein